MSIKPFLYIYKTILWLNQLRLRRKSELFFYFFVFSFCFLFVFFHFSSFIFPFLVFVLFYFFGFLFLFCFFVCLHFFISHFFVKFVICNLRWGKLRNMVIRSRWLPKTCQEQWSIPGKIQTGDRLTGGLRTWNFQGYWTNTKWNFQESIEKELEFPGVLSKN